MARLWNNIHVQVCRDIRPKRPSRRSEARFSSHGQRRHGQWLSSECPLEETRGRGDGLEVVWTHHRPEKAGLRDEARVPIHNVLRETRRAGITTVEEEPFQHLLLPAGDEERGGLGDREEGELPVGVVVPVRSWVVGRLETEPRYGKLCHDQSPHQRRVHRRQRGGDAGSKVVPHHVRGGDVEEVEGRFGAHGRGHDAVVAVRGDGRVTGAAVVERDHGLVLRQEGARWCAMSG